jgi:hypothetical protein
MWKVSQKDISGENLFIEIAWTLETKNQLLREALPKRKQIVILTHATQYIKI